MGEHFDVVMKIATRSKEKGEKPGSIFSLETYRECRIRVPN